MEESMDTLTRGGPGHQQMQQQSHDWYALCDSKEPMLSIQDFYETDDLQVWTYFEPILFCGFFLWSKRKKLSLSLSLENLISYHASHIT